MKKYYLVIWEQNKMKSGEPSSKIKYTKLINSKISTAKEWWKRNLKRGDNDIKYKKKNSHKI